MPGQEQQEGATTPGLGGAAGSQSYRVDGGARPWGRGCCCYFPFSYPVLPCAVSQQLDPDRSRCQGSWESPPTGVSLALPTPRHTEQTRGLENASEGAEAPGSSQTVGEAGKGPPLLEEHGEGGKWGEREAPREAEWVTEGLESKPGRLEVAVRKPWESLTASSSEAMGSELQEDHVGYRAWGAGWRGGREVGSGGGA